MTIQLLQARYFTAGRIAPIRFLVIHDMEYPERLDTAEAVAKWFAGSTSPRASTHYNIDADSVVQSVKDRDTAWCAPGANKDGLHFEHAGYVKQTRAEWLDSYGVKMLDRSARLVAAKGLEHGVPLVKRSPADIRAGRPGIVGHYDVTKAFPDLGSHTDPEPNFPWDYYVPLVQKYAKPAPAPAPTPSSPKEAAAMLTLVKVTGTDPVWVSNYIERRWVKDPKELGVIQADLKARGLNAEIVQRSSLVGYGIPVGPVPA